MRSRKNPPIRFNMKKWRQLGCPLTDVFCDGEKVPRSVAYDMKAGWVDYQLLDESGRPVVDKKQKRIILARRKGKITASFRHNVTE